MSELQDFVSGNIGKTYHNRDEASAAQREYCRLRSVPFFAPSGDCRCYSCGKDIYSGPNGYTVAIAASCHITGCPHCHHSFCD